MGVRAAHLIPATAIAITVTLAMLAPACLNGDNTGSGPDLAVVLDGGADLGHRSFDLAAVDADTSDLAGIDQAKPILDLALGDLTGLFNCYNVAVCDPNVTFCIKYFDGSEAVPGKMVVGSPACYQPDDTCANQGQNMDCGCIQNDATLGPNCQGSCVDNLDGTFSCYAK